MDVTKENILERIPSDLYEVIEFIQLRHPNDYYEINDLTNELIIDEVFYGGRQYMIVIDLARNKIKFIDDVVHYEPVYSYFGDEIDYDEWKNSLDLFKSNVESLGFKFVPTGTGGNDDYLWYQLIISVYEFTETKLLEATMLWDNYNNERRYITDNLK